MLPVLNRLRKRKDIQEVFQKGTTFPGRLFVLKIKKNNLSISRFAFIFPVKHEKKASKRNRGKRVFREVVREIFPSVKKGFDGIFIIKKEAEEKKYREVKEEIKKVFQKAKVIFD